MADSEFLTVDWRVAPHASALLDSLHLMLTDIDQNRGTLVRLSTNLANKTTFDVSQKMFMRYNLKAKKGSRKDDIRFWARMYLCARGVMSLLGSGQQAMKRFVLYKEEDLKAGLTMTNVNTGLHDIALTLGVHPLNLGFVPEMEGIVAMPKHTAINYTLITNITRWQRADGTKDPEMESPKRFYEDQIAQVPPLIKELKVVEGERPLIAVVVVEHRNLRALVTGPSFSLGDVMVVMTAGYPSTSIREFLHMLSLDPALHNVPFLFFSDHDLHGIQIFGVLKYGSAECAESSGIMVCSRLKWVGPSKEDLLASPERFAPVWTRLYQTDKPFKSEAEVAAALEKWKTQMAKKFQRQLKAPNEGDKGLKIAIQSWRWLDHEPELAAEFAGMRDSANKFRLADLAQVDVSYLRTFLREKVIANSERARDLASDEDETLGLRELSPEGQAWRAAASQEAPQEEASEKRASEEEAADKVATAAAEAEEAPAFGAGTEAEQMFQEEFD